MCHILPLGLPEMVAFFIDFFLNIYIIKLWQQN